MRLPLLLLSILTISLYAKEVTITLIVDDNVSLKDSVIDLRSQTLNVKNQKDIELLLEKQKKELLHITKSAEDNHDDLLTRLFWLETYKKNYILPVTYSTQNIPNRQQSEAQFQISFKKNILPDVLGSQGDIYLAYTQNSYWQVYDSDDSRPFRESNYAPEIYYESPIDREFFGLDFKSYKAGYIHQSNGGNVKNSRSWDRLLAEVNFGFREIDFKLTGWYRIPEKKKSYPGDPKGDDNPNITDYLGSGRFEVTIPYYKHEFGIALQNNLNFEQNRGNLTLDYSYPLSTFYLYLRYFSGYGESLVDYDRAIDRVGIGVLFNR
ncbi:MAG: phospholipase A [Campylobacterales bacterium]